MSYKGLRKVVGEMHTALSGVYVALKVNGVRGQRRHCSARVCHLQVDALLMTPLSPGASTDVGGKIWTAANDGTLLVWPDSEGTGNMDASKARVIKVEDGQCECERLLRQGSLDSAVLNGREEIGAVALLVMVVCQPQAPWHLLTWFPYCVVVVCCLKHHNAPHTHAHPALITLSCAAVRSMALSGAHVWCGCDDGQVCGHSCFTHATLVPK